MNAFIVGLALTLAAPAPKDTPKESPKLDGEWVVEAFDGAGEKGPEGGSVIFRFTEGKVSVKEGKREKAEEGSYTLDLKKKPATIDIRPDNGGGGKEILVLGILEITGDSMKLCFSKGGVRPTEFKGNNEKRIVMITLKRVKPEK